MKTKLSQKDIPKGWSQARLVDICALLKDGSHGTHQDVLNGIPLLSAKDIKDGYIEIDNKPRLISINDFNQIHKNYKIADGDVLLSLVGSIGKTAIVSNYSGNYTLQRSVGILRTKENSNNVFLYYIFNTTYFQNELIKKENKGAQGGVYLGSLGKIKINLPPLPEQKRIVGVLEVWDRAIEKLAQKIEKKKNIKRGMMQELLTGKTRLPGFTEKWETAELGEVCKFWSGFPFPSIYFSEEKGVRVIRNRDLKGDSQILYYSGKDIPDSYTVYDGDILVGMDGDFIACKWSKGRALLNQRVGKLTSFRNSNKNYLFYRIQTPLKIIEQETSSTTVKHLSVKGFEGFKMSVPPKSEQDAIADILVTADKEIEFLEKKLAKIKEQKQYLLNNLITGAIRVPEGV
jgi:type I restriction enzyme S subunit